MEISLKGITYHPEFAVKHKTLIFKEVFQERKLIANKQILACELLRQGNQPFVRKILSLNFRQNILLTRQCLKKAILCENS